MRAVLLVVSLSFVAGCEMGPQDTRPSDDFAADGGSPDCDEGGCSFDNGPSTACPPEQTWPTKSGGSPLPGCFYVPVVPPRGPVTWRDAGPHKM